MPPKGLIRFDFGSSMVERFRLCTAGEREALTPSFIHEGKTRAPRPALRMRRATSLRITALFFGHVHGGMPALGLPGWQYRRTP